MLSRIKALVRVYWSGMASSTRTGASGGKKKKQKKKSYSRWSTYLVYIGLYAYFAVLIVLSSQHTMELIIRAHMGDSLVHSYAATGVVLPFVLSLMTSLQTLYFSKDDAEILPLPVSAGEILIAKFLILVFNAWLLEGLFMGLPLWIYGVYARLGIGFAFQVLLATLLAPLIPVAFSTILIVFVMSFTGAMRNKRLVQVVSTLLFLAVVIGISTASGYSSAGGNLFGDTGLDSRLGWYVPLQWISDFLNSGDVPAFLALLGCSAGAVVLVYGVLHRIYFKGLIGSLFSSGSGSHKKINEKTAYKVRGLGISYVQKEMKTYIRSTGLLINWFLLRFLVPVLLCVMFWFSFRQAGIEAGDVVSIKEALGSLLASGEDMELIILLFILSAITFIRSTSTVVPVSKDGEDALLMKTFPISFSRQVFWKMIPGWGMDICAWVLFLALVQGMFVSMPASMWAWLLLISVPSSFVNQGFILYDLSHPRLHWANENQLIKGGAIAWIVMGINAGQVALFWLLRKLFDGVSGAAVMVPLLIFAAYTAAALILYAYIRDKDAALAKNLY